MEGRKVKVIYAVALVLVNAVLICGCVQVQTNTSTGSGNVTSEMKGVAPFTTIDFAIPGTLHVTQSGTSSVKVEAESSIVPNIRTEVVNGVLKISAANLGFQTTKPINVYVFAPSITSITNSGAGTILSSSPLDANALNLTLQGAGSIDVAVNVTRLNTQLSGAGSVVLRGNVINHTAMLTGVGSLRGYQLQTDATTITLTGVGSAGVTALKTLTASISGTGSVNYHGSPQVSEQRTGVGTVQKTD